MCSCWSWNRPHSLEIYTFLESKRELGTTKEEKVNLAVESIETRLFHTPPCPCQSKVCSEFQLRPAPLICGQQQLQASHQKSTSSKSRDKNENRKNTAGGTFRWRFSSFQTVNFIGKKTSKDFRAFFGYFQWVTYLAGAVGVAWWVPGCNCKSASKPNNKPNTTSVLIHNT